MAIARAKLTAPGRTSVPAEIRRKVGLDPGSVLEWDQEGGRVAIRREGRYSSEDLHRALFPRGPPKPKMLDEMTAGIRHLIRKHHPRG